MRCSVAINDVKMVVKRVNKRATGGIRRLLLTNPLNSQLDTNVLRSPQTKKTELKRRATIL